jgi:hypothetical protein
MIIILTHLANNNNNKQSRKNIFLDNKVIIVGRNAENIQCKMRRSGCFAFLDELQHENFMLRHFSDTLHKLVHHNQ